MIFSPPFLTFGIYFGNSMVMHLRSSPSSVIGKISCATGKYASGSFREGLKCVSHSRSTFALFAIRAASEKSMCLFSLAFCFFSSSPYIPSQMKSCTPPRIS